MTGPAHMPCKSLWSMQGWVVCCPTLWIFLCNEKQKALGIPPCPMSNIYRQMHTHTNKTNKQTHKCIKKIFPAQRGKLKRPKESMGQGLKAGGTRTQRNPRFSLRFPGRTTPRYAERRFTGGLKDDPPRTTRDVHLSVSQALPSVGTPS